MNYIEAINNATNEEELIDTVEEYLNDHDVDNIDEVIKEAMVQYIRLMDNPFTIG